jgi:hypothetical protein
MSDKQPLDQAVPAGGVSQKSAVEMIRAAAAKQAQSTTSHHSKFKVNHLTLRKFIYILVSHATVVWYQNQQ